MTSYGVDSRYEAHDRRPGLFILLIIVAIVTTIGSIKYCCSCRKEYKNPAKYQPHIKHITTGSVTGVRG